MSRRDNIFDQTTKMPWPVGLGFAVIVVVALHIYLWWVPEPAASDGLGMAMRAAAKWFGYGVAGLFGFSAFLSFLTQIIRSRRFKATRSISYIRSLSWRQFESFVGDMFRNQGYFVLQTPEGPDNGVDLVLRNNGEKTYVQCKHWKANNVGVERIRELLGSMTAGGAHQGIFVASGTYTQAAKSLANECGIKLIGGEELAHLLGPIDIGVEQARSSSANESAPSCPVCNLQMVLRTAKRGKTKGTQFWGCTKYPGCRGTRPA